MDHVLVFQLGWWPFDYLLNGHLRFTHDGEGGATSGRRFGVSSIATVRGRQFDSQAAVITQAFEVAMLPFSFSELPVCPNTRVGVTSFWCISKHNWAVA